MKYAKSKDIYLTDEECLIIYDFIINNYSLLLDDESILLKLKPSIREDLYYQIVDLYKENKTKYL